MDRLFESFTRLIKETNTNFRRYMYDQINWNNRLIGLTGPRGVGKTTLILQHIKQNLDLSDTLYVTVEDFYFADKSLVGLADAMDTILLPWKMIMRSVCNR